VHRQLIVAAFIVAGAVALIAPIVGASDEQIYVSCTQNGAEQKPQSTPHPHNCITAAASVRKYTGVLLLLDFQQIAWHHWGSITATAIANEVDMKAHTRTKVRFSVTGKQVCKGLTYYAKIVLESPKRLYPRHLRFDLACGSAPEELNS
jgi:hypothetical protein